MLLLADALWVWVVPLISNPTIFQQSRGYLAMERAVVGLPYEPRLVWATFFLVAAVPDVLGLLCMNDWAKRWTPFNRIIGYALRGAGLTALFLLFAFVSDMISRSNPGTTGSHNYQLRAVTAGACVYAIGLLLAREVARYRNAAELRSRARHGLAAA